MSQTILFVCPHGAAKSVIAAAYCQHLATAHGLAPRVASGGTEPAATVSEAVLAQLRAEGITVSAHPPQRVTSEQLHTAAYVVSLGCDLGDMLLAGQMVIQWDDVPPPSQNLSVACERIRVHVVQLLDEIAKTAVLAQASAAILPEGTIAPCR